MRTNRWIRLLVVVSWGLAGLFFLPFWGWSAKALSLEGGTADFGGNGAPAVAVREHALSTPELIEAAVARGEISRDLGDLYLAYALFAPERLPARFRSDVPWDGTLPLWELQRRQRLRPPSLFRSTIETLAATSCGSSSGNLPKTRSTSYFSIEYKQIKGGLTIDDYANALDAAWNKEITQFGWAAPPITTPGGKYHVRVDSLGSGLFGYVTTQGTYAGFVGDNPNTSSWNEQTAYASCMVLSDDFSGFASPALKALQATVAHEFHHAIQFGYGVAPGLRDIDGLFMEAGATWVEDEVFDDANDNYNYLWPDFQTCMGEYHPSDSNQWYPYWVVLRGLTERFGTGGAGGGEQVMQDFWESLSKREKGMLSALDGALKNKNPSLSLGQVYHDAAIALKFAKPCGGGYTSPYCFEEASGYTNTAGIPSTSFSVASVGSSYSGSVQDNYALNWITLPATGGPYTVTLQNTSSGGTLRVSVVGDTGSGLDLRPLGVVTAGQTVQVGNIDPISYTSAPVLVVTNEAQTADNPGSCTARSYTVNVTTSASTPPTSPSSSQLFLPVVMRKDGGISGKVTLNGTPVGGVELELRFYDGSNWSTLRTTTTAADGTFIFKNVPSLGSGQSYYVRYMNPSQGDSQGRLATWGSRVLTAYTNGTPVDLGTFDIADVTLRSPPPGASVTLPATFQWDVRPATSQDSYGVVFYTYDFTQPTPLYWQPTVGYSGSYTLNSLAGGLYFWGVYIEWPDGSLGLSYWIHGITISSPRLAPSSVAPRTKPAGALMDLLRTP